MKKNEFLNKSKEKSGIFQELQKSDFDTMLENGLEKNVCPVCTCAANKPEFGKFGLQYVRCRSCQVVYPLKYFKDKDLVDYYRHGESTNYFMEKILAPSVESRKCIIYPKRVELIEKFKLRGKILEVGCARGDFLSCFDKSRWKVFGIEINKKAIKYAREVNEIDVYDGEITDKHLFHDNSFDVIVIWEVLPFVNKPRDIVRCCMDLLSPGGLLLIGHPNIDCLEYRFRGKNSHFINCFMRNIFNLSSTFHLLDGFRYTKLDITNIGFEVISYVSKFPLVHRPVFKKLANTAQDVINWINWGNLIRVCIQVP